MESGGSKISCTYVATGGYFVFLTNPTVYVRSGFEPYSLIFHAVTNVHYVIATVKYEWNGYDGLGGFNGYHYLFVSR